MNNPATPGTSQDPDDCASLRQILARLGEKWTVIVLTMAGGQRMRFKEIHRTVAGISERMLAVTLRNLERDGLMLRTSYPSVPARVEYEISALGRSLLEAVDSVAQWVEHNRLSIEAARRQYDLDELAAAGTFK
jgi:DNA-binding HxlR family transcriptional regulator